MVQTSNIERNMSIYYILSTIFYILLYFYILTNIIINLNNLKRFCYSLIIIAHGLNRVL